jgi:hypothetical protein
VVSCILGRKEGTYDLIVDTIAENQLTSRGKGGGLT